MKVPVVNPSLMKSLGKNTEFCPLMPTNRISSALVAFTNSGKITILVKYKWNLK